MRPTPRTQTSKHSAMIMASVVMTTEAEAALVSVCVWGGGGPGVEPAERKCQAIHMPADAGCFRRPTMCIRVCVYVAGALQALGAGHERYERRLEGGDGSAPLHLVQVSGTRITLRPCPPPHPSAPLEDPVGLRGNCCLGEGGQTQIVAACCRSAVCA